MRQFYNSRYFFLIISFSFFLTMTGCKTMRLQSSSFFKDSTNLAVLNVKEIRTRDSVFFHKIDSIIIKGDTVRIFNKITYHYYHKDTVYVKDSTSSNKFSDKQEKETVIVEVEKQLKWWQKTLIWVGVVSLFLMFLIVVAKIIKWRLKKQFLIDK